MSGMRVEVNEGSLRFCNLKSSTNFKKQILKLPVEDKGGKDCTWAMEG